MVRLLSALLFFILSCTVSAQPLRSSHPFILGVTDTIPSAILAERRIINVYLPEGYSADSARAYPVIYLLDGSADEDFIHVAGLVQFLTTIVDTMPKTIVVGIANVSRKRDFTFPSSVAEDRKLIPASGGSQKFMDFIERELQPYVATHYKVNASKAIVGQSLGGLFAAEVLLKRPRLFGTYFIISPSLWWGAESLLAGPLPSLSSQRVYIAVGAGEEEQMKKDAQSLYGKLQVSASVKTTNLVFEILPGENHLTILHNALYKGFERMLLNKHERLQ